MDGPRGSGCLRCGQMEVPSALRALESDASWVSSRLLMTRLTGDRKLSTL